MVNAMHAEGLTQIISLLTLVSLAQAEAIFILERGHTDIQTDKLTDTTDHPTQTMPKATASTDNKKIQVRSRSKPSSRKRRLFLLTNPFIRLAIVAELPQMLELRASKQQNQIYNADECCHQRYRSTMYQTTALFERKKFCQSVQNKPLIV